MNVPSWQTFGSSRSLDLDALFATYFSIVEYVSLMLQVLQLERFFLIIVSRKHFYLLHVSPLCVTQGGSFGFRICNHFLPFIACACSDLCQRNAISSVLPQPLRLDLHKQDAKPSKNAWDKEWSGKLSSVPCRLRRRSTAFWAKRMLQILRNCAKKRYTYAKNRPPISRAFGPPKK